MRNRLLRLTALVDAPCDACWLVHGDEEIERCNVPVAVYGEPRSEVLVCREHETDFIYPIAGSIVTMPGLPGSPRQLDVDEKGNILGL